MLTACRSLAAVCFFALIAPPVGPASALDEWQPFSPTDASFRLEMPAAPTVQNKQRGFPPFDFVSTVYTARIGDDAFGLNHTDLPRVAFYFKSRSGIFDGARAGFLEDSDATELSFAETRFAGRDARELIYDIPASDTSPPLRGTARMFFDDDRLYIMWTEVTARVSTHDLDRYFGSLQIGAP